MRRPHFSGIESEPVEVGLAVGLETEELVRTGGGAFDGRAIALELTLALGAAPLATGSGTASEAELVDTTTSTRAGALAERGASLEAEADAFGLAVGTGVERPNASQPSAASPTTIGAKTQTRERAGVGALASLSLRGVIDSSFEVALGRVA